MVTRVNLLLTAVLLFRLTLGVTAQDLTCGTYAAGRLIQPNRIAAWHNPHGTQFIDGTRSRIQAPYVGSQTPALMCLINPWLAGWIDTTFVYVTPKAPSSNDQQWFAGPLDPTGLPYPDGCAMFNEIWTVDRVTIETHVSDWLDNGRIDDTLSAVFGWPGQGNPFFTSAHGFALPADHRGGWAEFADQNGNGQYDPHLGEYPCITLEGAIRIPDEMHWLVFHDQDTSSNLERTPIGMEIQLTAFGFSCRDDDILNNTLFHRYKLVHQGPSTVDSLHFGIMFDPDLGCGSDDMIGSHPDLSTVFIYNRDSVDGTSNGHCVSGYATYGSFPPMASMTWLSDTLYAFGGVIREDQFRKERFPPVVLGLNTDGTPMRAGGSGQNQPDSLPVTRYLFPGDPRDSLQWNAYDAGPYDERIYGVSVIRPGRIAPGETYIADMAFGFHQDSLANHLDQYPIMLAEVAQLQTSLRDMLDLCVQQPICSPTEDCVWPGDFNADGVVDPIDLLHWGVMHDSTGPARDGKINWAPHYSATWSAWTGDGIPFQHGDANGDGRTDTVDIQLHLEYLGFINPDKTARNPYRPGDDLKAKSYTYDSSGIKDLLISLRRPAEQILGIAFSIDYDRTTFDASAARVIAGGNGPTWLWDGKSYTSRKFALGLSSYQYAFIFTDHEAREVSDNQTLMQLPRLTPKPGAVVPDSTLIVIRYLKAIDAEGNDLHLGSSGIWIYKETLTSITDPESTMRSSLWPNPTSDLFHVDTPRPGDATLHDTQGRILRVWTAADLAGPLSLHELPAGLYFLKLRGTGEVLKVMLQ